MQITAENAKMFLDLWSHFQTEIDNDLKDIKDGADGDVKSSEARSAFFEKLIILDAGTFALSLSFVAALSTHIHKPASLSVALGWLYAAWIFLLSSMLFSWIHNLHRYAQERRIRAAVTGHAASIRGSQYDLILQHLREFASGSIEGADLNIWELLNRTVQSYRVSQLEKVKRLGERLNMLRPFTRTANLYAALAFISTLLAFLLALIFAIKHAWILTLPA